ncbi:PREDICTED: vegetative cell wall protein gp1-like [Ceratotherium simum simum]|uniref:Vegetative cell wall protein gp1-like n=1 Tax=Ceratotherium simum simum TaxID=73337 RepID=A0ABM1CN71_CERSS|nr:PREDICTED: vegetative cell wall protein gp1-like [Ceratotherium simum simum]
MCHVRVQHVDTEPPAIKGKVDDCGHVCIPTRTRETTDAGKGRPQSTFIGLSSQGSPDLAWPPFRAAARSPKSPVHGFYTRSEVTRLVTLGHPTPPPSCLPPAPPQLPPVWALGVQILMSHTGPAPPSPLISPPTTPLPLTITAAPAPWQPPRTAALSPPPPSDLGTCTSPSLQQVTDSPSKARAP